MEGNSVAMDGHRVAYTDVLVAIPGKHPLCLLPHCTKAKLNHWGLTT